MWTWNDRKVNKEHNSQIPIPANIIPSGMYSLSVGEMESRKDGGSVCGQHYYNQTSPLFISHSHSFFYYLGHPTFTPFHTPISLIFHWHFHCSFNICLNTICNLKSLWVPIQNRLKSINKFTWSYGMSWKDNQDLDLKTYLFLYFRNCPESTFWNMASLSKNLQWLLGS